MTITTSITLVSDTELDAEALEARFSAYFARDADCDLYWAISASDGLLDVNEGGLSFWVNTKYQLGGGRKIAQSLSGAFPRSSVTFAEYDVDGYGEERVSYLNGEIVGEKVPLVVPKNLDALVRELESALESPHPHLALLAARKLVKAYRA